MLAQWCTLNAFQLWRIWHSLWTLRMKQRIHIVNVWVARLWRAIYSQRHALTFTTIINFMSILCGRTDLRRLLCCAQKGCGRMWHEWKNCWEAIPHDFLMAERKRNILMGASLSTLHQELAKLGLNSCVAGCGKSCKSIMIWFWVLWISKLMRKLRLCSKHYIAVESMMNYHRKRLPGGHGESGTRRDVPRSEIQDLQFSSTVRKALRVVESTSCVENPLQEDKSLRGRRGQPEQRHPGASSYLNIPLVCF